LLRIRKNLLSWGTSWGGRGSWSSRGNWSNRSWGNRSWGNWSRGGSSRSWGSRGTTISQFHVFLEGWSSSDRLTWILMLEGIWVTGISHTSGSPVMKKKDNKDKKELVYINTLSMFCCRILGSIIKPQI
jgi:hypothetical protein